LGTTRAEFWFENPESRTFPQSFLSYIFDSGRVYLKKSTDFEIPGRRLKSEKHSTLSNTDLCPENHE
jgi:hypothetical protein